MTNARVATLAVPAAVLDALRAARQVALIGHVTPDADCLGAIGAMKLAQDALGLRSAPALPAGTVARKLQFMVDLAGVTPASSADLAACDVALVMDTAKDKRVNVEGKLDALPAAKIVNVDHHASNPGYGHVNWVEGGRSSSCEMVYELIVALSAPVTPAIATLLYAGIHSDTQGFSLSNTTPRSLEVGHDLVRAGANVADICERLERSKSRNEFELLKVIYGNTKVSADGRLAWSTANYDEIAGAGCGPNDIDDQVEIVRSIEGVQLAILFSEGNRGKVRMNFRGDRGHPVLALAQQFNGGGHEMAAGAILDGTIEAVVERVIPAAQAYVAGR